jgi:hypothetical protein
MKKFMVSFLSLVLALNILTVSAGAEEGITKGDSGIAPQSYECPDCGDNVAVSYAWSPVIRGQDERKCIHRPHGTDLWRVQRGTCFEECVNCNYYVSFDVSRDYLSHCGGYNG